MNVKQALKRNPFTANLYQSLKKKKDKYRKAKRESWKRMQYTFENRGKGKEKLCILLAGYKPFLYSVTFERIKNFLDDDIDMCLVTSGLYSRDLDICCKNNGWSYLYSRVNNVSLVQNLAIWLHPNAKYIYKMDEDIFVTKNAFGKMYETLLECKENGEYDPLFVAPLLPVNGYCHLRILKKLGLTEEYTTRFERPKFAAGWSRMIESNPDTAKFLWGGDNLFCAVY